MKKRDRLRHKFKCSWGHMKYTARKFACYNWLPLASIWEGNKVLFTCLQLENSCTKEFSANIFKKYTLFETYWKYQATNRQLVAYNDSFWLIVRLKLFNHHVLLCIKCNQLYDLHIKSLASWQHMWISCTCQGTSYV